VEEGRRMTEEFVPNKATERDITGQSWLYDGTFPLALTTVPNPGCGPGDRLQLSTFQLLEAVESLLFYFAILLVQYSSE